MRELITTLARDSEVRLQPDSAATLPAWRRLMLAFGQAGSPPVDEAGSLSWSYP